MSMSTYERAAHAKAAKLARTQAQDFVVLHDACYEDCEPESWLATSAYCYSNSTLEVEGCQVMAVYGPDGRLPDFG